MKINENTNVALPIRNLLAIIFAFHESLIDVVQRALHTDLT